MEQILFLVAVAVLSMLHSWWTKRKEKESEDAETPPPGQPERPAPKRPSAANWEDELRRLLEGEDDKPAPRPPPVIVHAPRPVAPPPLPVAPRPRIASRPPEPVSQSDPDMDTGLPVRFSSLEGSAQAFLRASNIEGKVAAHMQRADQQVASHPKSVLKREASPEVRQAVNLLRNRQSQRAVILAGVILGPPKAMEE
jgi:hypothetical protein